MRWRHTWPGGDRPHDEMLLVDDGREGRPVGRVDHVADGPEAERWRWFWQEGQTAAQSGACATKEAARVECERRAREAGL